MPNLVKIRVGDADIWMEADDGASAPQQVSVEAALERATAAAEQITNTICAYSGLLARAFREGAREVPLNKVSAEFGIKVTGEGNVYVVKTTGEASIKIVAEWSAK